jgi:hypothetical protein
VLRLCSPLGGCPFPASHRCSTRVCLCIAAWRRAKKRNMERLTLACGGFAINSVEELTPDCLVRAAALGAAIPWASGVLGWLWVLLLSMSATATKADGSACKHGCLDSCRLCATSVLRYLVARCLPPVSLPHTSVLAAVAVAAAAAARPLRATLALCTSTCWVRRSTPLWRT